MVSQAWKELSHDEREVFEDMARRDKARYEVEKATYAGPWKVPAKQRSQKDPNAPKRPMSAFLSFANTKRTQVKAENPDVANADISRIFAQMWKDESDEERKVHIVKELKLRREYKIAIAEWRRESECEMEAARKEREDAAMRTVMANKEQEYYHNILAVPYGHQPQASIPMHPSYGIPSNANSQLCHPASHYPSGVPPPALQHPDSSGMSDQRHGPPYSMDPAAGHYLPPTSAPYYYHEHAKYHYGGQQSYAPHQYQYPPHHTGGTPDEDTNKSYAGKFLFFFNT
jgi:hypothetical protein